MCTGDEYSSVSHHRPVKMDVRMHVFGVKVVATDMKAATAAAKMVPCRRPFWWVSIADSCEQHLWTILYVAVP